VPWHSYTSLFGNGIKASLLPAKKDDKAKLLIFHAVSFRIAMNGDGTMQDISAVVVPQLQAELTAIRGQVRRLPESVEKERASLLAAQIENGVPADFIRRQLGVMAG
jgi:hypothetical protein